MEKIILTEKTVGNIVGRLKKFMENKVFKSQLLYNIKPSKARHPVQYKKELAGKNYSHPSYGINAKVSRHPFSKGERMSSLGDMAMPLVIISFHSDAGMCFSEGDVFYFYGSMFLVDLKTDLRLSSRSSIGSFTQVIDKFQLINSPDEKLISSIKREYDMEEAYAKEYWAGVEEEWVSDVKKEEEDELQRIINGN